MHKLKMSVLMVGLAFGATVQAADVGEDSAVTLGEIHVQSAAGGLPARSVLSSVNLLGGDQVENQNVKAAWQLFNLMPGVMMTEFGMGTTSGKLSFRAFNGEGEINAVKLLIDGIPSNSNDGNMPYLDMVSPLDIQSIEVVKGTNDPRYGLHNIAGNANVSTQIGGNYTRARLGLGSFDTRDLQLAKGIEENGLSQNYFIGYQASSGWREHAESEKFSLAGKWFFTPNDGKTNLGFIARVYQQIADEAGYLTAAQAAADPRQSPLANASDGGEREMQQFSLHADHQFNDRLYGSLKAYYNHIDDRRWLYYGQYTTAQERAIQEDHKGVIGTMTWRPVVAGLHDLAIEGGVDAEWQDNQSQRYNIAQRVRVSQTRDQQFDFNIAGAFVQAVIRPTENLKIVPAYRVDTLNGNYVNRLTGISYDMNNYGAISQPKISAMYTLVPGYNLYGNFGRSFQVGVGTGSYQVNPLADQSPSLNDGWEAGLKFKPLAGVEARVAVWEQVASNELRRKLYGAANDVEAIGKTRRQGVDLEVSAKAGENTRFWAFYSYQDSKIEQAGALEPTAQGKEIDHVPHYIVSAGVEHRLLPDLRIGATVNSQGDYYVERTNTTGKFGGYTLLNLSANYQLNKMMSLDFQIKNATDSRYEYVWYQAASGANPARTFHSPGDGRGFFAALNVRY